MKRPIILIVCFLLLKSFLSSTNGQASSNPMQLWYNQPSKIWEEALPIGNGFLGAMVFGNPNEEHLQLNHVQFWAGSINDNVNPNGGTIKLNEIRNAINDGNYALADKLANQNFVAQKVHGMPYQPVGDVFLKFDGHENFSDLKRTLDIEKAIASTTYVVNGIKYTRTVFSSFADNFISIKIEADQLGKVSFGTKMTTEQKGDISYLNNNTIELNAVGPDHLGVPGLVRVNANLYIKNEGGNIRKEANKLFVENANSATLYITMATNFNNYKDLTNNAVKTAKEQLSKVIRLPYENALNNHIKSYSHFFKRVSINLGNSPEMYLPTNERIINFKNGKDPQLVSLYFQFGRYLLISCSQPKGQAANLQGMWNPHTDPPWGSQYTDNINLEMNYWPAEVTNLTEMHEPLVQLFKDLSVAGQPTAKKMYNANGWVLHHNTDLFRMTAAIDGPWGLWPTGGAWLAQNMWEKYAFNGDKNFLKSIYPAIKGASTFFMDVMYKDPATGWWIVSPSASPENAHQGFSISAGTTMDNQLVFSLFNNTIKAATILGVDSALIRSVKEKLKGMAPMQIGQYSQLQEWMKDWDNPEDKHRHISHLWGLYPGNLISPYNTPKLFEAAKTSLIYRGDVSTGWSMGWKVNCWARLLDGDHAYKLIKDQLSPVELNKEGGGTYPNLFDAHPPFQIDGNFGCTSGIAEMLIQSQDGAIHLLPALPSNWKSGEFKGLKARGGFEIDVKWEDYKIKQIKIKSTLGGNCRIRSYEALYMKGAKSVNSSINNTNGFFQVPNVPQPLISTKANLKGNILKNIFEFDLPTKAGESYNFIF